MSPLLFAAALLVGAEPSVTAAPEATFLRLRAVGDVMLGSSVPEGHLPPDDGARLVEAVASVVGDADVSFANLEGPLCDSGSSSKCRPGSNCYAFRTPTRYGRYLVALGLDLASTANNHAADFGEGCRRETEKTLDSLGIAWSGPPGTVGTFVHRGKKLALVAFYTGAHTNDLNDLSGAMALVRRTKATHELVVVSFHGGAEGPKADRLVEGAEYYLKENRGDLRRFARGVVDAGADLVLGHGPHVLRALEVYRERLIAYSLGNFATYGRFSLAGALGVGAVLEVEMSSDGRFLRGKVLSTLQEGRGVPALDPQRRAWLAIKRLTALDSPQTTLRFADDGTFVP